MPDRSAPAPHGAKTGPRGALELVSSQAAWRFLIVVELANFIALRRHVGRARANALIEDAVTRAGSVLPDAAIRSVGRVALEVECRGEAIAELHGTLDLLQSSFAEPFDLDGERHVIEITLAAAATPIGLVEDVRLAEEAEEAIGQARVDHRRVVRDLSQRGARVDRLALKRELPAAIANGEMFLQYQPKIHIRRQEIASAEALVRWQHPTRGLILPGDFITLAEETRAIRPLTLWTLERVIADQQLMAADGHDLTVFVNISGQLLADLDFIETACAMVADSGGRIGFEITETSMIRDPEVAAMHLTAIAESGVPIAIDDYGAGLSSLAYLKKLPASELKIDKMFVMELTSSNRDPLIVRSTIDLAHAMDMQVTAEGVETPAALALLSVMGCDMAQGFLLSRPISIDAFRQYLAEQAKGMVETTAASLRRPPSFWKSA